MNNKLINDEINESIEELNNEINYKENSSNLKDNDDNTTPTNQENVEQTETIDIKDANTSNCLALTIREEHKLVAVKNVFLHSIKVTWKVVVSAITLHLLKIFM